jgi:hypothetical protein
MASRPAGVSRLRSAVPERRMSSEVVGGMLFIAGTVFLVILVFIFLGVFTKT